MLGAKAMAELVGVVVAPPVTAVRTVVAKTDETVVRFEAIVVAVVVAVVALVAKVVGGASVDPFVSVVVGIVVDDEVDRVEAEVVEAVEAVEAVDRVEAVDKVGGRRMDASANSSSFGSVTQPTMGYAIQERPATLTQAVDSK